MTDEIRKPLNKMINLDQHNALRQQAHMEMQRLNQPHPNGIECPKCGSELWDTDMVILTSYPPQKNVDCHSCGWTGYRLA